MSERCSACHRIHDEPVPCPICGGERLRQDGGREGLQVSDGLELRPDDETDPDTGHYSASVICLACGLHGPDEKNCRDAVAAWNRNAAIIRPRIAAFPEREAVAA